jgi:hypothetical protein
MAEQRTSSKTTVSADMTTRHVDTVTSRNQAGAECGKDVVVITRLNATPIKAISHYDKDGWLMHRFSLAGAPSLQIIRRLRRGGEVTTSCRHFRHTVLVSVCAIMMSMGDSRLFHVGGSCLAAHVNFLLSMPQVFADSPRARYFCLSSRNAEALR